MGLNKDELAYLRSFRNNLDNDNVKLKQQIKQKLLNDKYIIHVLNNKELEENDAEPDDYFGVNIRPAYIVPETQTDVMNYICFETNNEQRYPNAMKTQQIIFYILVDDKNMIDKDTSLARHDLLAALIQNMFNYEVFLGGRWTLISDKPSVTDNHYLTRTLIFQQNTDNNLVKTVNGKPKIINHDISCERNTQL